MKVGSFMSDLTSINIESILENSPSKVTTHYHSKLKAYLSVVGTTTYIWCSVNEEWIPAKRALQDDPDVLDFELLN